MLLLLLVFLFVLLFCNLFVLWSRGSYKQYVIQVVYVYYYSLKISHVLKVTSQGNYEEYKKWEPLCPVRRRKSRDFQQKTAEFYEGHVSWNTAVICVSIRGLKPFKCVNSLDKLKKLPYFTYLSEYKGFSTTQNFSGFQGENSWSACSN
jgi:hypothetical protein